MQLQQLEKRNQRVAGQGTQERLTGLGGGTNENRVHVDSLRQPDRGNMTQAVYAADVR